MTKIICLLLTIAFSSCVIHTYGGYGYWQPPVYVGPSIGLGTIIAVVVSWTRNKSILLAIIHGILGWLYVIYAIIVPKR
ncbi:MAG TPA: hypothetical protein VKR32_15500 [Puia sp.]|nr:hypothetical protein [Puia sp.]